MLEHYLGINFAEWLVTGSMSFLSMRLWGNFIT
jgi:hypothetical protein